MSNIVHYAPLAYKFGLLLLYASYSHFLACFTFKINNGYYLTNICNVFVKLHNIHSHKTRSCDINFHVNQHFSSVHKKFLVHQGINYWNSLSNNITSIKSFTKFKCDVFECLTSKYV